MGDKHDNNPKVDRSAMLQIEQDEQLAKELQNQVNEEDLLDHSSSVDHPSSQNDLSSVESPSSLNDTDYVAKAVQERVNSSQKLLLVVRRGAPFFRLLGLWQQEVNRSSVKYALRVCYHGEEGTDSGAMGKQFFTQMIQGTDIISSESPMLHTSLTQRPILAMPFTFHGKGIIFMHSPHLVSSTVIAKNISEEETTGLLVSGFSQDF